MTEKARNNYGSETAGDFTVAKSVVPGEKVAGKGDDYVVEDTGQRAAAFNIIENPLQVGDLFFTLSQA